MAIYLIKFALYTGFVRHYFYTLLKKAISSRIMRGCLDIIYINDGMRALQKDDFQSLIHSELVDEMGVKE